jgi:hypothetical protein
MSSQAEKPVATPSLADEAASLVAAAEDLAKWAATQKTKGLDFSVDSLGRLDDLLTRLAGSKDPIGLKTRLGCAAYVGEVLVRRLGGRWGTGEFYGEVLPPGSPAEVDDEPEGLARPTEMVERRLAEKVALKQQVLEQGKAWAPAEEPAPEGEAPAEEPAPEPDAGPTPEQIEAAAKAEEDRLAAEQAAADRVEAERLAAETAEAERAEAERLAAEKAEVERAEAERLAAEKAEAERVEAERLAAEKAEAERRAAEKAEAEKASAMMRLVAEAFVGPATANGAAWLDYTPASVMLLDDLIAAWWPATPEKGTYESMIPAMGAYVGEVLVREAGGRWIRDPGEGYAVDLGGRIVFPMKQIAGRFELGAAQSIGRFYAEASAGPAQAEGGTAEQPAKKRRFFLRRG